MSLNTLRSNNTSSEIYCASWFDFSSEISLMKLQHAESAIRISEDRVQYWNVMKIHNLPFSNYRGFVDDINNICWSNKRLPYQFPLFILRVHVTKNAQPSIFMANCATFLDRDVHTTSRESFPSGPRRYCENLPVILYILYQHFSKFLKHCNITFFHRNVRSFLNAIFSVVYINSSFRPILVLKCGLAKHLQPLNRLFGY